MRLVILAFAAVLMAWQPPVAAQQQGKVDEGMGRRMGRPHRDPAVAPDGKVWFVGQAGNYIAHFDPKTEQFKRYEIEEGTNPTASTSIRRGSSGTGNRNGRIGRLRAAAGSRSS